MDGGVPQLVGQLLLTAITALHKEAATGIGQTLGKQLQQELLQVSSYQHQQPSNLAEMLGLGMQLDMLLHHSGVGFK